MRAAEGGQKIIEGCDVRQVCDLNRRLNPSRTLGMHQVVCTNAKTEDVPRLDARGIVIRIPLANLRDVNQLEFTRSGARSDRIIEGSHSAVAGKSDGGLLRRRQ